MTEGKHSSAATGSNAATWSIGTIVTTLTSIAALILTAVQVKKAIEGEPSWFWLVLCMTLLVVACLYWNLKRRDAQILIGVPTRREFAYAPWLRYGSLGAVALIILGGLTALMLSQKPSKTFNVLIADLEGPAGYGISEIVIDNLQRETKQFSFIKVVPLKKAISAQEGTEAARQAARTNNADAVIWGWYRKPAEKVWVTLRFERLTGGPDLYLTDHGGSRVAASADLDQFILQKQLSSELTSLAFLLAAVSKLDSGDDREAYDILTAAINFAPSSNATFNLAPAFFYRAFCTTRLQTNSIQGKPVHSTSLADLTRAIELNPTFTHAYVNRASERLRQEQFSEALADCEEALKRGPNLPAMLNKSSALCALNRFDEALFAAEAALRMAPDPRFLGYATLCRAQIFLAKGDHIKALEDFTRGIALAPDTEPGVTLNRGDAYFSLKQYDKAVADFTRLIQLAPSKATPYKKRGNCFFNTGDYNKAIADYDRALARYPDDAESHLNRGMALNALRENERALFDFQRAKALDTNSALACFSAGISFLNLGNFPAAETNFSEAILRDKAFWDAYTKRGALAAQRGDFKAAVSDINEALRGKPTDPREAYFLRGQAHFVQGNYSNAIADLEQVIGLHPNAKTEYIQARLQVAGDLQSRKQYEDAIAHYARLIQVDPTNAITFYSWGVCLKELGRITDARAKYAEALRIDPMFAPAWHADGLLLKDELNFHREALECLDKAIELAPKMPQRYPTWGSEGLVRALLSSALSSKGDIAARLTNHTLSISCFKAAAELDPRNWMILANWANSLVALGRYREANDLYAQSVTLNGGRESSTYKYWGQSLLLHGDTTSAISKFERCIALHPLDGEAHFAWANALASTSPRDALVKFATASKFYTNNSAVYMNWGNTLMNLGLLPDAEEKYRTALALRPSASDLNRNLGLCLLQMGRSDEAQTALEKSIMLDPEDGIANYFLGVQYASKQQNTKAAIAFETVLKAHSGTKIAEDARTALEALRNGTLQIRK